MDGGEVSGVGVPGYEEDGFAGMAGFDAVDDGFD